MKKNWALSKPEHGSTVCYPGRGITTYLAACVREFHGEFSRKGGTMSSTLHYKLNYSEEPIRLFKSDFLEFFTHITPQAVVIIWTPTSALASASSIVAATPK